MRSLITRLMLSLVGALLLPLLSQGQTVPPIQTHSPNPPTKDQSEIKVLDAYREGQQNTKPSAEEDRGAGLGDEIFIKVQNLQDLLDKSKCRDREGNAKTDCHPQEVALFLDGRKIKNLVPESGAPKAGEGTLQFHLDRSADSDETWADLLGNPPLDQRFWARPTKVSVGLENDIPVESDVTQFSFHRVREHYFWACLAACGENRCLAAVERGPGVV
jgi:hypothetical protein